MKNNAKSHSTMRLVFFVLPFRVAFILSVIARQLRFRGLPLIRQYAKRG